ncbi:MAG: zinc-binding dehydrogenase [Acidimicrobiia bacterium]
MLAAAVAADGAMAVAAAALAFQTRGGAEARAHLERAIGAARSATRRERQHVEIVAAILDGDLGRARALGAEHLADFPRDALVAHCVPTIGATVFPSARPGAMVGDERRPVAEQTMKAIVQSAYGTDPDAVLAVGEVERPEVGPEDVLVRVRAASVDRGTWHCMTGRPFAMRLMGFGVRSPKAGNPGRALAGTVEAVGERVTGFRPGDDVYGSCDGSFADYVRADATMLAPKPANLSFEQAATVPISGGTALQAVRKADVQPGQRVLVVGASGGVSSFAVQIAKAAGAHVTAVCSTSKVDLVRSLGADHVIDYTRADFTTGDERYDVVLDTGGTRRLAHLRRVMTPDGTLVIVGGETGGRWLGGFDRSLRAVVLSPFVSQRLGMLASTESGADLRQLGELIESGRVTPALDRTYPLAEVPAAVRRMADNAVRGKIAIVL